MDQKNVIKSNFLCKLNLFSYHIEYLITQQDMSQLKKPMRDVKTRYSNKITNFDSIILIKLQN